MNESTLSLSIVMLTAIRFIYVTLLLTFENVDLLSWKCVNQFKQEGSDKLICHATVMMRQVPKDFHPHWFNIQVLIIVTCCTSLLMNTENTSRREVDYHVQDVRICRCFLKQCNYTLSSSCWWIVEFIDSEADETWAIFIKLYNLTL